MSTKTYATITMIIAFGLAAFIAIVIVRELPLYLPLVAMMVALVVKYFARRMVKDILTDERNSRIDEKATTFSYRVYAVIAAMSSLMAMLLRSSLPEWVWIAGQTLAYSLCILMLIHVAASKYYGNKH